MCTEPLGSFLHHPRATSEKVNRGVVDEMPDEDADPAVTALVDLSGFDDLLLKGCRDPPVHHVAGASAQVKETNRGGSLGWERLGNPDPP